jgi:coenzyme PQQ precursor peptide PqqA
MPLRHIGQQSSEHSQLSAADLEADRDSSFLASFAITKVLTDIQKTGYNLVTAEWHSANGPDAFIFLTREIDMETKVWTRPDFEEVSLGCEINCYAPAEV